MLGDVALVLCGGRDRRRSGDPTLFRRVLCRLSYSTVVLLLNCLLVLLSAGVVLAALESLGTSERFSGPDGVRTRDLRLDRPA
jgi:hypothetical protein